MLKIGQFSKLAKVTIKTLRYYDKIGLLKPAMVESSSSYRYYSESQLQTVALISSYKSAGLSNDLILKLLNHSENKLELLEKQKQLLIEQENNIKQAILRIDELINKKEQPYKAEIKRIDKRLVYRCRGYVSSIEKIHDFIKNCADEFVRSNPDVKFSDPDYCCVIYPDDRYREDNIFVEYAQSVDRVGKDTDILKFSEIEPITAISVLHYGDYKSLPNAYIFTVNWAREHGYQLCGEPRERYINGAWNVDDVSKWLTELQLPIKE